MLRFVSILLVLLSSPPAFANNGLTFEMRETIAMRAKILRISIDEIRIDYVFENRGNTDQTLTVAFQLPRIRIDELDESFPAMSPGPFFESDVQFDTWINSEKQSAQTLDAYLSHGNSDLTAQVRNAGVPDAAFRSWPALLRAAHNLNLIDLSKISELSELGREGSYFSNTELNRTWHFPVTFPAGTQTRISHRYRPAWGTGVLVMDGPKTMQQAVPQACIADSWVAYANSLTTADNGGAYALFNYDFSVWNWNWTGRIDRFHLIVETPHPDVLFSSCDSGIQKTSPTTFEAIYEDFAPEDDRLFVTFYAPSSHWHWRVE